MSKRISINEELCTGCGNCETGCEHGALKVIEGKARLVRQDFCDGLGACIGTCPTGALRIVDTEATDDSAVCSANVTQAGSANAHPSAHHAAGGCPGSRLMTLAADASAATQAATTDAPARVMQAELGQWPIQLHLLPTNAPFLRGKELVLLASCAAVASPDVQWRFIRGRAIAMACPKLDRTRGMWKNWLP